MPLPLIPIIGAAIAGGVVGACVARISERQEGYYFNEEGYDSLGFDREGFDREGFNKEGFDRDGFNRNGLDPSGFDRDGRDKDGYDHEGLDANGRNRKGYDLAGWNEAGRDVTGHDAAYYETCVSEIKERLSKAEGFISSGDFEHASLEIRKGAEQVVSCIIAHNYGIGRYKRHFESDIDACKGVLGDEMIGKLQNLRRICGDQLHIEVKDVSNLQIDSKYVENLQSKLSFCMKTLEEALFVIEGYADGA